MFFSNLSQFGVNGKRLCVLHTDFMWLPAVLLVGHACECNFISVLFCSQLTALSVRQHCRPRSISRNSFPNTWMDLFSYVSFIHESSKLLCTCSRKYVKETCTYLYQPLKQNSATEFFFKFFWAASVLGQCLGRQCFGGPSFSCEMIIWRKKRHGENKRVLWEYEYLRLLFRGKNSFNFSIKNISPYFQAQCIASCLNAFFVEMRPF